MFVWAGEVSILVTKGFDLQLYHLSYLPYEFAS